VRLCGRAWFAEIEDLKLAVVKRFVLNDRIFLCKHPLLRPNKVAVMTVSAPPPRPEIYDTVLFEGDDTWQTTDGILFVPFRIGRRPWIDRSCELRKFAFWLMKPPPPY